MKRIALVLCALVALAGGAAAFAQGASSAQRAGTSGVVGTAKAVDEAALAFDDGPPAAASETKARGSSTLTYFIRMVVVLALVAASIYLVLRFIRRFSSPRSGDEAAIKVLASSPLGTGKALHVVSLGSKAYLIGSAEQAVSLIAELDDKEFVDGLALKAATAPTSGGAAFGEILASMLGGKARRAPKPSSTEFLAGQRKRLRKF